MGGHLDVVWSLVHVSEKIMMECTIITTGKSTLLSSIMSSNGEIKLRELCDVREGDG